MSGIVFRPAGSIRLSASACIAQGGELLQEALKRLGAEQHIDSLAEIVGQAQAQCCAAVREFVVTGFDGAGKEIQFFRHARIVLPSGCNPAKVAEAGEGGNALPGRGGER